MDRKGIMLAGNILTDTVKMRDADGTILKTVDRSSLVAVQTPQIFDFKRFFLALSEISSDIIASVELMLDGKIDEAMNKFSK